MRRGGMPDGDGMQVAEVSSAIVDAVRCGDICDDGNACDA